MDLNDSTKVGLTESGMTRPSRYVRAGEKVQRGWAKLLEWELSTTRTSLNRLVLRNRLSRKAVVGSAGPIVSLTTFGPRIQTVHVTIESIAAGSELPSRLILWLDEKEALRNLPLPLKRLQARGLEIKETPNYGPYKKFYPYLESMDNFATPLITADDDTIYPNNWLSGFIRSYKFNPAVISCYRAHEIKFAGDAFAPYVSWGRCRSNKPSFRHFATGVSGILYPPEFLVKLKEAGKQFEQLCPRADDIWLHLNAIRSGFRIKQVRPWQMNYLELPNSQETGLAMSNVHSLQNDLLLKNVYTQADLDRIQSEPV